MGLRFDLFCIVNFPLYVGLFIFGESIIRGLVYPV